MSGVMRTMGKISGIASQVLAFVPGMQPIAAALAVNSMLMKAVFGRKPGVKGSVNAITLDPDAPSAMLLGRTYAGGSIRHDAGWGGTVNGVENPYRAIITDYSVAGPVDGLEALTFDYVPLPFGAGTIGAATGHYAGFLWRSYQLGARPEASALPIQWAGLPGWGSTAKLSGKAAVAWQFKWDKKGKVFAGGSIPLMGAIWRTTLCYDPRLDSTVAGGSGAHRWADPASTAAHDAAMATWTFTKNPALHALHYALGRFDRDPAVGGSTFQKIFGIGHPVEDVLIEQFMAWANVCDANDWTVGGEITEPGDKWDNQKAIMQAGGAEPVFTGAMLGVNYCAPRASATTITVDDLAEGPVRVREMQGWRDRRNSIAPKYRSETHNWQYVQGTPFAPSAWRTADGELKPTVIDLRLVQVEAGDTPTQPAQLAAYAGFQGRERMIDLSLKAGFIDYYPGQKMTIDLPDEQLHSVAVTLLRRTVDPLTLTVQATFRTEASTTHSDALAAGTTPPPTPPAITLGARDGVASTNSLPDGFVQSLIATSSVSGAGGNPISAVDAGSNATVSIAAHDRDYSDKSVAVNAGSFTGLTYSWLYLVYYDDAARAGGAVTYAITDDPTIAYNSPTYPDRHFVGYVTTPASGGAATGGGGAAPPGWGGGNDAALP